MSLISFKIMAIISIFVLTLISGIIPLRFALKNTKFLHLGDAFAGGIFLSAGLLHLLPDAEKSFQQIYPNSPYPFAQLYCVIAFVFLLLLEKGFMIYGNKRQKHNDTKNSHDLHDLNHSNISHNINTNCETLGCCQHKNLFTPIILLVVLSIHSFVEGLAIGISGNIIEAMIIFIAVIVHKGSESLALTNNLYRYKINIKHIVKLIALFSCMTPLGIFLASLINADVSSHFGYMLEALFNAFASGTFVYLGTIHIIECEKSFADLGEILALLFGITIMSVVALWT